MNQPIVYIIILNWNGYIDTSELLDSLFLISYTNFKIVVVDNNSVQSEVEMLTRNYGDRIHLIACENNLGFSGGNNVGIKYALKANADFVLLLNNDTIVEPNFLEGLLEIFEQKELVGISAPHINYYHNPKIVWSAGGKIIKLRGSGFAESNKIEADLNSLIRQVEFVSGCCMLIKREVFETVGLFDEKYFLYIEDTDLCFRLSSAGFKIYVTPKSKIFHKVRRSTEDNLTLLPLYYSTRNRLYFAKKNYINMFFLMCIYLLATILIKSLFWSLTGKRKNVQVVRIAFKDFFSGKMGKVNSQIFI